MIKSLTTLALLAAIATPALADDGILPQQSKVVVNHEVVQQGVPAGHGATTGKKPVHHKHAAARKAGAKHTGKHHRAHKAAAKPAGM